MTRCPSHRCTLDYGTRSAAISHFRMRHANSYILCSFCDKIVYAPSSTKLKAHYQRAHPLYSFDNDANKEGQPMLDVRCSNYIFFKFFIEIKFNSIFLHLIWNRFSQNVMSIKKSAVKPKKKRTKTTIGSRWITLGASHIGDSHKRLNVQHDHAFHNFHRVQMREFIIKKIMLIIRYCVQYAINRSNVQAFAIFSYIIKKCIVMLKFRMNLWKNRQQRYIFAWNDIKFIILMFDLFLHANPVEWSESIA